MAACRNRICRKCLKNGGSSAIIPASDFRTSQEEFAVDDYRRDEFSIGTTKFQLNLIYLVDTSGSMYGEPINQLNVAMAEAVQVAEEAAMEKEVQLLMRVVEFNTTSHWLFGDTHHGVEHIDWMPLTPNGATDTAGAIDLACSVMHREILGERNYRPVVILITDGMSSDPQKTVEAVAKLKASLKSSTNPNKDKITRIAIGVTGANQTELTNFASIGTIEREDGTLDENVPFVFNVDDIGLLKGLLKGVTVSSIASSLAAGVGGDSDDVPVIVPTYEGDADDDDWKV